MTTRVGIAVGRASVRAIAIRNDAVLWAVEGALDPEAGLERALTDLLEQTPKLGWRRPRVTAAVGAPLAQVKNIGGLPPDAGRAIVQAIVREHTSTFFLGKSTEPRVTRALPTDSTNAIATMIERSCLEVVVAGCQRRGWDLRAIAPTGVVLRHAVTEANFSWSDGSLVVEVQSSAGLDSVRTHRETELVSTPGLRPALNQLGARAADFADAYGAACLEADDPLSVDPASLDPWHARRFRRTYRAPALGIAFGLALLLAAPVASEWGAHAAGKRAAATDAAEWQQVVHTVTELERTTEALVEARRFSDRAGFVSRLGALTRALPDSSVLQSLVLDERGGDFIAVTRDTAALFRQLTPRFGITTSAAAQVGDRIRLQVRFATTEPPQ